MRFLGATNLQLLDFQISQLVLAIDVFKLASQIQSSSPLKNNNSKNFTVRMCERKERGKLGDDWLALPLSSWAESPSLRAAPCDDAHK